MKIKKQFNYENIQGFKFASQPIGKPKMFSHIYFIDGLLIDTGHRNMQKEILQEVSNLDVRQIFITHHHEDHTGNMDILQNHFQVPSYASSRCVEIMKKPPSISFAQRMTWGNRPPNFDLQVKENFIETENYRFELIPIPGHAIDMLALYERNQGWLFSADLWVNDFIRIFMRPESMKQQIESLKRVLKLDFEVLLCSHNPQFKDGKLKVKKKLVFLEYFYQTVANLHQKGFSPKAIIKEMKLKEDWSVRILSGGSLSTLNMIKSVIRDEAGSLSA